jgi:hypothetical protein
MFLTGSFKFIARPRTTASTPATNPLTDASGKNLPNINAAGTLRRYPAGIVIFPLFAHRSWKARMRFGRNGTAFLRFSATGHGMLQRRGLSRLPAICRRSCHEDAGARALVRRFFRGKRSRYHSRGILRDSLHHLT